MKVDTFSDKKLASTINQSFLPLLIDRELEPELDRQLQLFIEEQRGFGGWPLTVILTPQGHPVVGFSYIDANSLNEAIEQFLKHWKNDPQRVLKLATASATARLNKHVEQDQLLEKVDLQAILRQFLSQISSASDDRYGGFGERQKYPNVVQLNALLDLYSLNPDSELGNFLQLTLDHMLEGALRDQLGGGFFRYSDNRNWNSPHFEQMLYTQALMGKLLVRAGQTFKKPDYLVAGRDTLLNMVNKFRDKNDLYHASLSAVDENNKAGNIAGGYYLWRKRELDNLLGKRWQKGVSDLLPSNKIMVLPRILPGKNAQNLKAILLKVRNQRVISIDDKKLLAWQGLALSGLSYGAQLSKDLANAGKSLRDKIVQLVENQQLQRLIVDNKLDPDGKVKPEDMTLEGLVYLAQGLLDWWQVSGDEKAKSHAESLLLLAYQQFYKEGRWQPANKYGLLESPPTLAIDDTQLPSPSAIWLSLAWALTDIESNKPLNEMVAQVANRLPQAMHENAFFHASLISTLIAREWRLRNNRSSISATEDTITNINSKTTETAN